MQIPLPSYSYNDEQYAQNLHKQNTSSLLLLSAYSPPFFFPISPVISTLSLLYSLLVSSSLLLSSTHHLSISSLLPLLFPFFFFASPFPISHCTLSFSSPFPSIFFFNSPILSFLHLSTSPIFSAVPIIFCHFLSLCSSF